MRRKLVMLLIIAFSVVVREGFARGCSLPLEPRKASFVVSVRIDQKGPFRFLLDTGTSVTVISPALAETLAVRPEGTIEALSTTGPLPVSQATLGEVRAGTITQSRVAALIAPVPQWAPYGRIDGILGMNFLAGRSYLIDIRGKCLDVDLPVERVRGGSRVKARQIVGRVAVESAELLMVLDSAASLTVLTSARAGALAKRSGIATVGSAAGRQLVASGIVPALKVGDITLRDLPALVMPAGNPSEDALLPVNIFSSVYVDAARSLVVLNGTPSR